jgi:hypothetical protein
VRMFLLLIVAAIFLTGVVWWAIFIGNAVRGAVRKR